MTYEEANKIEEGFVIKVKGREENWVVEKIEEVKGHLFFYLRNDNVELVKDHKDLAAIVTDKK